MILAEDCVKAAQAISRRPITSSFWLLNALKKLP
ncbi:unnamed protein product [Linum tenue]|uniref:Uncharacterized protein n=1 Tax=Linum tenue TaxID=586396 RepID=A0AAV0HE01_9ROSI|nr:unnamed protein product [Linum tenue]CAI0383457.1 unnamed protein product [Linum tenue]